MAEMKHTPTPWFAEQSEQGHYEVIATDAPKTKRRVGRFGGPDRGANAAMTARAVNSHADLVEALRAAQVQLAFWGATADKVDGGSATMPFMEPSTSVLRQIGAALRRAEWGE